MPHISTYGGSYFSAQPEKEDFGSFEPREAKFQESSTNDELTGRKGLNWRELCDVGTSLRQSDEFIKLGDIKGEFQADELTGKAIEPAIDYRNQDIQQLYVFQGRGQNGPGVEVPSPYQSNASCEEGSAFEVNKEVVSIQDHNRFNPGPFQKGSAIFPGHGVIAEDHSTGSFRDSLTGEGRPTKIWTNGGASTFEDGMTQDFDSNDVVFGVKENIDWTAANGGPGSSYLTARLAGTAGPGGSTYMTETFEPLAGMNSFGESLNPVLELAGTAGPGGSTYMTGQFEMPTDNIGGQAGPGGTTF